MDERYIPAGDDDTAALAEERRQRGRRIVRIVLLTDLAVLIALAAFFYIAGSSFHDTVRQYDTVSIILLKDPQDPAKQCRCLQMTEGLDYLAFRVGISVAFGGPKTECGHDALIVFSRTGIPEQYQLAVSTRCNYIKYPPTEKFPFGEPRAYFPSIVGGYLDRARSDGVDCECADG